MDSARCRNVHCQQCSLPAVLLSLVLLSPLAADISVACRIHCTIIKFCIYSNCLQHRGRIYWEFIILLYIEFDDGALNFAWILRAAELSRSRSVMEMWAQTLQLVRKSQPRCIRPSPFQWDVGGASSLNRRTGEGETQGGTRGMGGSSSASPQRTTMKIGVRYLPSIFFFTNANNINPPIQHPPPVLPPQAIAPKIQQ